MTLTPINGGQSFSTLPPVEIKRPSRLVPIKNWQEENAPPSWFTTAPTTSPSAPQTPAAQTPAATASQTSLWKPSFASAAPSATPAPSVSNWKPSYVKPADTPAPAAPVSSPQSAATQAPAVDAVTMAAPKAAPFSAGTLAKGVWEKGNAAIDRSRQETGMFAMDLAAKGLHAAGDIANAFPVFGQTAAEWTYNRLHQAGDWIENVTKNQRGYLRQRQQALEDKYAPNARAGGKAAQLVDSFGVDTVRAIPEAVTAVALALASGGASAAGTTAGLVKAATENMAPAAASALGSAIQTAVAAMSPTAASAAAPAVNAAASAAAPVINATASVAGNLARNPQYWFSFLDVLGNSYADAVEDLTDDSGNLSDADQNRAMLYAVMNSLINAAVEIGPDGASGLQGIPQQVMDGGQSALKAWVSGMVDEGKEEVIQGILERDLQNLLYQKGNPIASTSNPDAILNPSTAAREFAGGAVVGGILGGGEAMVSSAVSAAANHMQERQAKKQADKIVEVVRKAREQYFKEHPEERKKAAEEAAAIVEQIRREADNPQTAAPQTQTPIQAAPQIAPPQTVQPAVQPNAQEEDEWAGIDPAALRQELERRAADPTPSPFVQQVFRDVETADQRWKQANPEPAPAASGQTVRDNPETFSDAEILSALEPDETPSNPGLAPEPAQEYTDGWEPKTAQGAELWKALDRSFRVSVNDRVFSVTPETLNNRPVFRAEYDYSPHVVLNGIPVFDGNAHQHWTGTFPTREEAVRTLVQFAENNRLLRPQETAPQFGAVSTKGEAVHDGVQERQENQDGRAGERAGLQEAAHVPQGEAGTQRGQGDVPENRPGNQTEVPGGSVRPSGEVRPYGRGNLPGGYRTGGVEAAGPRAVPGQTQDGEAGGRGAGQTVGREGQSDRGAGEVQPAGVGGVPDGGAVLQPPRVGQDAGGLDGGVAAVHHGEDGGQGDAVPVPSGGRDENGGAGAGQLQDAGSGRRGGGRQVQVHGPADGGTVGRNPDRGQDAGPGTRRDGPKKGGDGAKRENAKKAGNAPKKDDNASDKDGNSPHKDDKSAKKKPAQKPAPEKKPQDDTPEKKTVREETKKEAERKTAQAAQPGGRDFVFPDKGLDLPSGAKARFRANVDAIQLVRKLEAEGRPATADEQAVLSRFVGWGGLSQAFDETNQDWAKEYAELKELFSEEEYRGAFDSTRNAHYTSQEVITGIYRGLETLGFTGGRLLEPSAGIGHFNGAMPANLRQGVKSWTMVELDPLTGSILKALYPNADVRIKGFQDTKIPADYMDAAISNVPFGNYSVFDKAYPKYITKSIHNYFLAKMLDSVRPGGLVAAVTSSFTMDAYDTNVRKYIMDRADLLGAVRLPNTAFKSNAGTEVVTDILIFKKRPPNTPYTGEDFAKPQYYWFHDAKTGRQNQAYINEYFVRHPEMMLGKPSYSGGMYGRSSLTFEPLDNGKALGQRIQEALSRIDGKMEYPARPTPEIRAVEAAKGERAGKIGQIVRRGDGKLAQVTETGEKEVSLTGKRKERLDKIVDLRDMARELMRLQKDGADQAKITKARQTLNKLYDGFTRAFGPLHKAGNLSVINQDIDAPFILSLENWDKDSKTASKADVFSKNTVTPARTVTHADSIGDALAVSINSSGSIDLPAIASLLGRDRTDTDAVQRQLLDAGLVYLNRDGELETPDTYLSGNVRAKLRDAEALAEGNPDYRRNVEALKKVIPPDVEPEDIRVNLGASWIPDAVYQDFIREELGVPFTSVTRVAQSGNWHVVFGSSSSYRHASGESQAKYAAKNNAKWAAGGKSALEILDACLNSRQITVSAHGKVDMVATAAAQQKQAEMEEAFANWLWKDGERRDTLAALYNEVLNNTAPPVFDGSKLEIGGMRAGFRLRSFQADAVQRIVYGRGNVLLDHCVGAGKTFTIAAACMKMREIGTARKPLITAPKALVAQWGEEFYKFFPGANILVLKEDDYKPNKRKETANRIATGDWDAVILSYEQYQKIPLSDEFTKDFYRKQIAEYKAAVTLAEQEFGKKHKSVKEMAKALDNFENKLRDLENRAAKDADNISFEDLGIDALFVDEAHNFKNLQYVSHMNRVGGLGNRDGSKRAFDMLMKTRYLSGVTGGRNVCFATATPMMNAIPEIYTMQRYLDPDGLDAAGLTTFDAWAKQFGVVEEFRQQKIGGGYEAKQFLTRYRNLPELQRQLRNFMDVLRKLPKEVKIPKMKGGGRIVVECESSDFQKRYFQDLGRRAEKLRGAKIEKGGDNTLKVYTDGRKVSLSQKLIDPSLPFEPEGKIAKCAENLFSIWKDTADRKGTQIVFLDMSIPGSADTKANKGADADAEADVDAEDAALAVKESEDAVSAYAFIRNQLIGMGVPAEEIAFIHDANSQDKRKELFKAMNEGRVRVLLGSTEKMGVGMNAQEKVVAMHHLNPPHRPGDIEQREGRGIRQKNENDEVAVYVYVTKGSIDTRMWQNLNRKQQGIDQIQEGSLNQREMEGDSEFAVSAQEIASIASGNPLIMEQFEVGQKVEKLENLRRAHVRETFEARKQARQASQQLTQDRAALPRLQADADAWQDTKGGAFAATVLKQTYTERKDAGQKLLSLASAAMQDRTSPETITEVGSFAGLRLSVSSSGDFLLSGQQTWRVPAQFDNPVAAVRRLENVRAAIDNNIKAVKARIALAEKNLPQWEERADAPFPREQELADLKARETEIMDALMQEKPETGAAPDETPASGPDRDAAQPDSGRRVRGRAETDATETNDELPFTMDGEEDAPPASGTEASPEENGTPPTPPPSGHPEDWTTTRVGDPNKKPMRLSDLCRRIEREFRTNLTIGHLERGRNRGEYSDRDQGIRTRVANDLPTISHELGHHLDRLYHISDNMDAATLREIVKALPEDFARGYKAKELPGEGLAEFVRLYLKNSYEAQLKYPRAVRFVLNALNGRDRAHFIRLADEVNAALSLDTGSAVSSIRTREDALRDRSPWDEKLRRLGDRLYQAWNDSWHGIKTFTDEYGGHAYILAANAAHADAVAASNIVNHLSDANGNYVGPGLAAVLEGLDLRNNREYMDFGEYLIVRHAPERLAEGKRVYASDVKNNPEWMANRQTALEAQYPRFRVIADRLYAFQSMFLKTWGVETGLVSQDEADRYAERWQFYVPFNRVMDDSGGHGQRRGFANQDSTIRRATDKGSGREIIHPVDSIMNNMVRMITAAVRNNVLAELTNTAIANEAHASWLELIPEEKHKVSVPLPKAEIREAVQDSDLSDAAQEAVFGIIDDLDDLVSQYQAGNAHGNIVTVMKDGKRQWWKVNDKLLLESLTNMGPVRDNQFLEVMGKFNGIMTAAITGLNVKWSVTSNSLRDIQTLLTYQNVRNAGELFRGIGESYLNKVREQSGKEMDYTYMEYLAMGGGHESAFSAQSDLTAKMRDKLARKMEGKLKDLGEGTNPVQWLGFLSDIIESGPRYATYKLCRQQGLSAQDAFFAAMDATVNFRRGGILSKSLNKIIPFFNASIQGTDKFLRHIIAADLPRKDREKAIKNRILAFVTSSFISGVLEYALNCVDPERRKQYAQLSTYTKNAFWCIPRGDGKYWCIPKARELAVLSNLTTRALELAFGNDMAFREFSQYVNAQFFPSVVSDALSVPQAAVEKGLGPALHDAASSAASSLGILGVFTSLALDRDFLGRPVVPYALSGLEAPDQFDRTTSRAAVWIGRALRLSPVQIDYAGKNILGGLWEAQKFLYPMGEENKDVTLGIYRQFNKDNVFSNDYVSWLYEHADKTSRTANSHPSPINAAAKHNDANMTTFYSRFNRLAKQEDAEAVRPLRQPVLTMLHDYRRAVVDNVQTPAEKAVYAVLDTPDDAGKCLPSVMDTSIKDGKGVEHVLTARQYLSFQALYNGYYWEAAENALPLCSSNDEARAVLAKIKSIARDMAVNDTLAALNAPPRKSEDLYEDLALYRVSMDTFAIAKVRAAKISSLKDSREEPIDLSESAQIAEMVDRSFRKLSDTQRRALLKALNVSETVIQWTGEKLTHQLDVWRRKANQKAA